MSSTSVSAKSSVSNRGTGSRRKVKTKNPSRKVKAKEGRFTAPFMEPELKAAVTIPFESYQDNVKEILDEYGFVVVTGILSEEERTQAEALIYEDLLEAIDESEPLPKDLAKVVTDIRKGKLHWPKASIPGIPRKGFMSTKGIPQGRFSWTLRTNEKCKQIYQYLHSDDDLVVGQDVAFFNPDDTLVPDSDLWPHADQDTTLNLGCPNSYQGILYVWESDRPNTSNTIVWPRSPNNQYEDLLQAVPKSFGKGHALYIEDIPNAEVRHNLMDGWKENSRRIDVPAGSLLIFNSKTIHQGYPGGYRLAQPLSWEPRVYRNDEALLSKLKAMHTGKATTHWASLGIHHGASNLRWTKTIRYSDYHHECVIPTKKINTYALNTQYTDTRGMSIADLLGAVKDEYKDCI